MRNGKIAFNVYLQFADRELLNSLAERLHQPASQVIRTAIINYHRMVILGVPTCASGMACFWPGQHPAPIRPLDTNSQVIIPTPPTPTPSSNILPITDRPTP